MQQRNASRRDSPLWNVDEFSFHGYAGAAAGLLRLQDDVVAAERAGLEVRWRVA
jgi:hypothetical protein